jgi:hypothetical protein
MHPQFNTITPVLAVCVDITSIAILLLLLLLLHHANHLKIRIWHPHSLKDTWDSATTTECGMGLHVCNTAAAMAAHPLAS